MIRVQGHTDSSTNARFYTNDATPGSTYGSRSDAQNRSNAYDANTSEKQLSQLPLGGNPRSQASNAAYLHPAIGAAYGHRPTAESLGIKDELDTMLSAHNESQAISTLIQNQNSPKFSFSKCSDAGLQSISQSAALQSSNAGIGIIALANAELEKREFAKQDAEEDFSAEAFALNDIGLPKPEEIEGPSLSSLYAKYNPYHYPG